MTIQNSARANASYTTQANTKYYIARSIYNMFYRIYNIIINKTPTSLLAINIALVIQSPKIKCKAEGN